MPVSRRRWSPWYSTTPAGCGSRRKPASASRKRSWLLRTTNVRDWVLLQPVSDDEPSSFDLRRDGSRSLHRTSVPLGSMPGWLLVGPLAVRTNALGALLLVATQREVPKAVVPAALLISSYFWFETDTELARRFPPWTACRSVQPLQPYQEAARTLRAGFTRSSGPKICREFLLSVEPAVRRAGREVRRELSRKKLINRCTSERPLGLAQTRKVWTALQIPQKSKIPRVLELMSWRILFAAEHALLRRPWVEDPVLSRTLIGIRDP